MLPTEFAKLTTEAGKLGVAKGEITEFAKIIATVSAATDTSGEKLAQYGATAKTIFGMSTKEVEIYFGAINALDDKVGGTTETIADFVGRTGAIGKLANINAKELAAMGSTFLSVGISSERAATASNSLIGKLLAVNTLSPKSKASIEAMGLSVNGLQSAMAKDGQQGMLMFLEKLRTFSPSKQLEYATSIFGRESADEILTLVAAFGKYQTALGVAGSDAANVAKLQDELQKKLGASNKVFMASLQALGISLGSAIVPALNSILSAVTPVVNKFAEFARANPQITTVIVAVVGLTAVIFPLLAIVGTAITAFGTIASTVGIVGAALGGLSGILGVVGAAFAFILSPIGLFLAGCVAVGVAAGAIVANWSRIQPFFSSLWANIRSGSASAWQTLSSGAANAANAVMGALRSLPSMAFNAGVALGQSFANGIRAMISQATSAVANMTSAVRQYLPFSPAKEGALSDLDKVDIVGTIADNIDAAPLLNRLNGALGQARSVLSPTSASGSTGSSGGSTAGVQITYSPQVTVNGEAGRDMVLDVLREHSREVVNLLDQGYSKIRRTNF
jgi:TP901 family phage tail tape measure protein